MDLKAKLKEAKKSTKVALVGGAVVVAGSWGSCQFNYDKHSTPAVEEDAQAPEPEAAEPFGKPEAEEAEPAAVEG